MDIFSLNTPNEKIDVILWLISDISLNLMVLYYSNKEYDCAVEKAVIALNECERRLEEDGSNAYQIYLNLMVLKSNFDRIMDKTNKKVRFFKV